MSDTRAQPPIRRSWTKRLAALFAIDASTSQGRVAEAAALLLIVVGCAIDFLTGPHYSPLLFYIPPIIYVAWFAKHRVGWAFVALAAVSIIGVHVVDEIMTPGDYSEDYNALTRAATVALAYWITRKLRQSMTELHEAKLRLEKLNRDKDLLFGVISHDLRGPFSSILAFSQLMRRSLGKLPPEKIKEYAELHYDAAQRTSILIENLLKWAQLQMNQVELEPKELGVPSLLETALETIRPQAAAKGVHVFVEQPSERLTVYADPAAVETILRNLIHNAVKFTPPGGRIAVGASPQTASIEIWVRDTGVGIAPERMEQLFVIVPRGATRGTNDEAGTGLGLLLCRELVERGGGRIYATSTQGQGSRFAFTVPRASRSTAGVTDMAVDG